MIVEAIVCPQCHQLIWSRSRHDMHYCFCGYCFIDGGRDYTRCGYGGKDWPEPWLTPVIIKFDTDEGATP